VPSTASYHEFSLCCIPFLHHQNQKKALINIMVWFGFYKKKKVTRPNFFLKKTETGSNRPVSVRFFRTKTGLAPFSLSLARFFPVFSVWVRFFRFQAYKTEPVGFFKILIRFFSQFGFFSYFFLVFSI